jgi:hypothetical protein
MYVYFDINVRSDLVRAEIDPVAALNGTEFVIAMTPDLRAEYEISENHVDVPIAERALSSKLLAIAVEIGVFGFAEAGSNSGYSGFDHGMFMSEAQVDLIGQTPIVTREGNPIPKHRTDAFLSVLAAGAIVITNDRGGHWNRARAAGYRVYRWDEVIPRQDGSFDLADRLRELVGPPEALTPARW